MPKQTAEQRRQAAKQKADEKRAAEEEREAAVESARKEFERWRQLTSVVEALAKEMPKNSSKAATLPISQLSLDRINKSITAVKELTAATGDDFIKDITVFVPAGDMPEYRDAALVLGQLAAGLRRFHRSQSSEWQARLGHNVL